MPREKQVNSLQDLCLSKIRRTLEDVWWPCCHADLLVGDLSIFVGEAFQVANESDEVQPFQFLREFFSTVMFKKWIEVDFLF